MKCIVRSPHTAKPVRQHDLPYHVYILTNARHTTFYTGVTGDIFHRIYRHKKRFHPGFTKRYNLDKLLHYEKFEFIEEAIKREKHLKRWKRAWKLDLIRQTNPGFEDLAADWYRHLEK